MDVVSSLPVVDCPVLGRNLVQTCPSWPCVDEIDFGDPERLIAYHQSVRFFDGSLIADAIFTPVVQRSVLETSRGRLILSKDHVALEGPVAGALISMQPGLANEHTMTALRHAMFAPVGSVEHLAYDRFIFRDFVLIFPKSRHATLGHFAKSSEAEALQSRSGYPCLGLALVAPDISHHQRRTVLRQLTLCLEQFEEFYDLDPSSLQLGELIRTGTEPHHLARVAWQSAQG